MIELDFRNWLVAQTAITNVVGNRIYPTQVPQGCESPAITMPVVSKSIQQYQQGQTSTVTTTFNLNCWAEGNELDAYYEAKALAKIVRDTLDIVSATMGTTNVYSASVINEQDQTFVFFDGYATGVQGVSIQVELIHSEA